MNDVLVSHCHIQQARCVSIHLLLDVDGMGEDLAGGETRGCVTWRSDGKVKVGDRYNVGEGGDVVVVDIASFLADYAD